MRNLRTILQDTKQSIDSEFATYFLNNESNLKATTDAMGYMLNLGDGGKRIRPAIVMAIVESFKGNSDLGQKFASAVEFIHTYTLIIDDIQDNGLKRRGLDTCHIKFGVNTAILAAARLFERGLYPFHKYCPDVELFEKLNDQLHRGQAADLNAESWSEDKRTVKNLQFIHSGKTSSLIQMSILGGCIASNLTTEETDHLLKFGYFAGLAFQAQDDILSQISTTEELGKLAGENADMYKLTYPNLYGSVEKAVDAARQLSLLAKDQLSIFKEDQISIMIELADYAVQRKS